MKPAYEKNTMRKSVITRSVNEALKYPQKRPAQMRPT